MVKLQEQLRSWHDPAVPDDVKARAVELMDNGDLTTAFGYDVDIGWYILGKSGTEIAWQQRFVAPASTTSVKNITMYAVKAVKTDTGEEGWIGLHGDYRGRFYSTFDGDCLTNDWFIADQYSRATWSELPVRRALVKVDICLP